MRDFPGTAALDRLESTTTRHHQQSPGLANLPLHCFDANQSWCALVMLAVELTSLALNCATTHRGGLSHPDARIGPRAGNHVVDDITSRPTKFRD